MTFEARLGAQVLLGALSLAAQGSATGQTAPVPAAGATLQVRSLAATCAACHGTDGAAVPGSAMVPLAGYPQASLVTQMRAFRDRSRDATVMHQIARGYTDRQIDVLARYFASLPAARP